MANLSKRTTNHDEIRQWAEARGGKPSTVAATHTGSDAGIIRIDFPGFSGEGSLEEITWEEFFEKFDQAQLALIYQEQTAEGAESNFNRFVKRDEQDEAGGAGTATRGRGRKTGVKKSTPAKKTAVKKAAPAKKTAAKKVVARKAVKKAAAAKKTAAKKALAKKAVKKAAKKTAVKKAVARKAAAKKAVKKAAKKTAAKKAAPARKATKKAAPAKKASGRR